jgi:hypothetical protein
MADVWVNSWLDIWGTVAAPDDDGRMRFKVEIDWDRDGFNVGTVSTGEEVITGGGGGTGDQFGELFGETFGTSTTTTDVYGDAYSNTYGVTEPIVIIDTGDDVSALVRPRTSPISAEYGRDQSTALAPTVAGRASVTLDNRDRRFSPRNATSPLYGKVKPARPVRITRDVAGSVYTLFRGHTDDSPINPDLDSRTVAFSLVDSLADFRGQNITTGLYQGVRTGDAINLILDAFGWPADLRDVDAGATFIRWWWEDNTDALTALDKIVRSEGPPAILTVSADGSIVFRDRHHRLIRSASTSSQQTWRGAENSGSGALTYRRGVNLASAEFAHDAAHLPGVYNVDYTYPTTANIAYVASRGHKVIRLPFRWERIQPTLGGALNAAELARIQAVVTSANANGMQVILDVHNYAEFINSTANGGATLKLGGGTLTDAHLTNL